MGLLRVGDDGATFYQAPNGTRYRLSKGEPIGRIHSIVIGPPAPQINVIKFKTTHTKMRCRTRISRPAKIRARRRGTGSQVRTDGSVGGSGSLTLSEDFVAKLVIHIVRPHLDDDRSVVTEEDIVFVDQEPEYQKPRKIRPPEQNELPKQKLSEFEEIMRKRKNKVDTMDNTGRMMKSLSSQSDLSQRRSQLWNKVRECLKEKSYYNFASKRMGQYKDL